MRASAANFVPTEDVRTVVRAPYLLPQRSQDGIAPSLPTSVPANHGPVVASATSEATGTYPGTLIVAQASTSQGLSASNNIVPKLPMEVEGGAQGVVTNAQPTSEPFFACEPAAAVKGRTNYSSSEHQDNERTIHHST